MKFVLLMAAVAIVFCVKDISDTAQCAMLFYLFVLGALWKTVLRNTRIVT